MTRDDIIVEVVRLSAEMLAKVKRDEFREAQSKYMRIRRLCCELSGQTRLPVQTRRTYTYKPEARAK